MAAAPLARSWFELRLRQNATQSVHPGEKRRFELATAIWALRSQKLSQSDVDLECFTDRDSSV